MSSIQPKESYSIQLGKSIIEKIEEKYPNSSVAELNLTDLDIPHLNPESLRKLFAPADFLSTEELESVTFSNNLIQQLTAADIIVIGAPLYNFTIPSTLKAWIDHITRPGITFGYGEDGRPTGLITGKKVYVAMSSGGVYSEGAGKANDFVVPYLQAFLGFLGMTNLTAFRAEGLKVPELKENAMSKAINSITID